ncbi:histidine kinase [Alkalispirochaeta sphaeroplastigenens]|uniref:histidine kinase n=1 Tax=Alkalispirochaeta sphaeroplastigenens TaxID=1187066 RepID=A0A2S4JJE4_9SPIO|nr:sensor histidine kinase [Alkalispirochaeta sphaeroplastigenens]POQ99655.1 histidine kinase [Alkalispirochaeta sphaeroplastigenens]
MFYLILAYLLFALVVMLRHRKTLNILWFLMMPLGICLALLGLLFFTEYISYANFIMNPLFGGENLLIWRLNYYLNLSVFGMYRLMNLGITLYLLGALGYPLSFHPNRSVRTGGYLVMLIIAGAILLNDPALLQMLFQPHTIFHAIPRVLSTLYLYNSLLRWLIRISLTGSALLMGYIHLKTPPIFKKQSLLIIGGIMPIHVLVVVLFFWFPSHSIHIWRFSTLKHISLPYTRVLASSIVLLSFLSMAALIYTALVYNSFELKTIQRRRAFQATMKTAHSGIRIFSHSIKNQFIAIRLLAEQGLLQEAPATAQGELPSPAPGDRLQQILSICEQSIARLSSIPALHDRITLSCQKVALDRLLTPLVMEFPQVTVSNPIPQASIVVDEHYFGEILRNLIVNSQEALLNHPAPRIHLSCERNLSHIVIRVTDNGCGISREHQKQIFNPFFSTKPSIRSWGLGLAFSRQLVEAFGGALHVESTEGVYTRMELYIPEDRSPGEIP